MNLSALPVAILAQILNFHVQNSAIELWKCGDSLLNYKLSTGGVEHIFLSDSNPLSTSRWPRVLSNFRKLRFLIVVRTNAPFDLPEVIRKQLRLLPPTLETLQITCWEAAEAFLSEEAADVNLDAFYTLAAESEDATHQLPASMVSTTPVHMWDMTSAFPNLKILGVNNAAKLSSYCPFTGADFVQLPRSLQNLTFHIGYPPWKLTESTQYPPGLTHLWIRHESISEHLIPTLPSSMTSIDAITRGNFYGSILHAPCFDSLTQIRPLQGGVPIAVYTQKGWKWPPHLSELWIVLDESLIPPTLPDSLTLLRTNGCASPAFIRSLPRSLTGMSLSSLSNWSNIQREDWPRLSKLHLSNCRNFTIANFKCLPRSLENLNLFLSDADADYDTFAASCAMSVAQVEAEISGSAERIQPAILDSICKGWHFGLPLNLKTLHIFSKTRTAGTVLTVPPFVTAVRLGERFCIDHRRFAEKLPPKITSVSLAQVEESTIVTEAPDFRHFECLSMLSIHASSLIIKYSIFRCLPQSLRTLDVFCRPSCTLTIEDFSFLPKGLETIRCSFMFDDSLQKADPSYVTPGRTHPFGWEDEMSRIPKWIDLLPKGLLVCDMSQMQARSDDLINLPSQLRELRLGKVAQMSPDQFRVLPQSLRVLHANFVPTVQHMRITGATIDKSDLDEQSLLPPLLWNLKLGASFSSLLQARKARVHANVNKPLPLVDPRVVKRYRTISSSSSTVQ